MIYRHGRPVIGLSALVMSPVVVGSTRLVVPVQARRPAPPPSKPYPTAADAALATAQAYGAQLAQLWAQFTGSVTHMSPGDPCYTFGADPGQVSTLQQCSDLACSAAHYAQLAALGWATYWNTANAWSYVQAAETNNDVACTMGPRCTDPYEESSFGLVAYTQGSGGSTSGGFQCVDPSYQQCVTKQVLAAQAAVAAALATKNRS